MGFSANVISAMIDVTTELLKDQQRREEQKFLLAEQERIAKENAQTKMIYKEKTQQNSAGNQLIDTVGREVGKQIGKEVGKKLLDQLF